MKRLTLAGLVAVLPLAAEIRLPESLRLAGPINDA